MAPAQPDVQPVARPLHASPGAVATPPARSGSLSHEELVALSSKLQAQAERMRARLEAPRFPDARLEADVLDGAPEPLLPGVTFGGGSDSLSGSGERVTRPPQNPTFKRSARNCMRVQLPGCISIGRTRDLHRNARGWIVV